MAGRRNEWTNYGLLTAVNTSANTISDVLNVRGVDGYAIQASLTLADSPNVVVTLSGSLDNETFTEIAHCTLTDNNSALFNVSQPHYEFARIQFDWYDGFGTISANAASEAS